MRWVGVMNTGAASVISSSSWASSGSLSSRKEIEGVRLEDGSGVASGEEMVPLFSARYGRRWGAGSSKRSSHSRGDDWHEDWWHIWRDVGQVTLSVQSAVDSLAVLHDSVLVAAVAHELLPVNMGLVFISARLVLV